MIRLRWTSFRRVFSSRIICICNSKCSCLTHITTTKLRRVKNRPTARKREKARILQHICMTENISCWCPAKCFQNPKFRRWRKTLVKYMGLGLSWKTTSPTIPNLQVLEVLELDQTRSRTRVDQEGWQRQQTRN